MAPFQADDNVVFMYHCLQNCPGKIDWNAVAIATGSTKAAVEMRWRRLKKKIEGDTNPGQPATPKATPASQGPNVSQGKKKNSGSRKRKVDAVDDEDNGDAAGPPQVDGPIDAKPSYPRRRTRGKKLKYDIRASFAKDEDSSAITSPESDEDYVVDAESIKSEDDELFMMDSGDDLKPKAKRNKKSQPLPSEVQLAPTTTDLRRLYVGNLPFATTEGDLRQFFIGYDVDSVTITKSRNKYGSGYAVIDLKSEDAGAAVRNLSRMQIRGRKVTMRLGAMHKQEVVTKLPHVLKQSKTVKKKATPPQNGKDIQKKLFPALKVNAKANMHPSDKPLPSIEHSPPTTPLSTVSTIKEQASVVTDSDIALQGLKADVFPALPSESRPLVSNRPVDGRVSKQNPTFSLVSVMPSSSVTTLSTTTDSIGKTLRQGLADHVEIWPEDSVSNIAVRGAEDPITPAATPIGIVANTFRFLKGLLTPQT